MPDIPDLDTMIPKMDNPHQLVVFARYCLKIKNDSRAIEEDWIKYGHRFDIVCLRLTEIDYEEIVGLLRQEDALRSQIKDIVMKVNGIVDERVI